MRAILLFILVLIPNFLVAENSQPIFLLHGFLGWGREEMNDYYCWGGKFDLETWLREQGFEVYTLSLGPVSSNWDRAVEAFYQIKGGQVDYGAGHSEEFGLIQKPEESNHRGFYPEWDADHPIHIIGHSMGGMTARKLEFLLKASFEGEESELLSLSLTGWITSVTTISTPHNGTTLSPIVSDIFPFVQKLATVIVGIQEDSFIEKYYDFDLGHWRLNRGQTEPLDDYYRRLRNSTLNESENFCLHDLSIEGARRFNSEYNTDPETYYFSYATYATKSQKRSEKQIPDDMMSWNLWSSGFAIGRSKKMDPSWYENDGIVNTISMYAPFSGDSGPEPSQLYDGIPVKGTWQFLGRLHMDHHKPVGHSHQPDDVDFLMEFYFQLCSLLYSLD